MRVSAPKRPEVRLAKVTSREISRLRVRSKRSVERQWKVHQAEWVDPYPWVMGTLPEKLVFAWLANHGIPFTFQASLPDVPDTLTVEDFRPDFLLEQFKVVIEVQGEYWHSLPEQAEHDVYKFAVYKHLGYEVYWFWETDILTDLARLMASVKEISGYSDPAGWVWEHQVDDLAALRAANSNRRRAPAPALGSRTRRKQR